MSFSAINSVSDYINSSQYATLALANSAAVSAGVGLNIDIPWTLTSNITFSAKFVVFNGGFITRRTFNVTFNNQFYAPSTGIFDKTGTGVVLFNSKTTSDLRWFSPTADGVTDDTLSVSAWNNSSPLRFASAGSYATSKISLKAFNNDFTGHQVVGVGPNETKFVSLAGDHIFEWSGTVNMNNWEIGNFSGYGPVPGGPPTGSGYVLHFIPTLYMFSNHIHDVFAYNMGGGIISDGLGDPSFGYFFSTKFTRLQSVGCLQSSIDLLLANTCELEDCYVRDSVNPYAGYRLRGGGVLRNCNGIDNGGIGVMLGMSTSPITISNTTGGDVVIPADAINANTSCAFYNCNIEDFVNVGVVIKNGMVKLFDNQTGIHGNLSDATIGIYINVGTIPAAVKCTVENYESLFSQPAGAAWAYGVPIVSSNSDLTFLSIGSTNSSGQIPYYDISSSVMRNVSSVGIEGLNTTTGDTVVNGYFSAGFSAGRILKAPQKTIATLNDLVSGNLVWCTDLGGGAGFIVYDHAVLTWKRLNQTDSYFAQNTTAGIPIVLANLSSAVVQDWSAVTLTGDLTVGFSAGNLYKGLRFHVVTPGNLGGHLFKVALTAGDLSIGVGKWITVEYTGSSWIQVAGGTLLS